MRVLALQSARDFEDVRRLTALRAHRLTGTRRGQWALDLTGRWRLIIDVSLDGKEATIVEVSHHYGD